MSEFTVFVQIQGESRIADVTVTEGVTGKELHNALSRVGLPLAEVVVFVDEEEEPVAAEGDQPVPSLKHGARLHLARCRSIKTTVHFLEKTVEYAFPPGTRVRRVKNWAAHEFHLDHKDAAEHVLQICNSRERPASDTPLHALAPCQSCAVCFDLVPEKRIEGAA